MPVSTDAVKELAIAAMKGRFGEDIGKAYGFLMFGGFGIPGATLAARADAEGANDLTQDLALSLVTDSAKAGLTAALQAGAADALEAAGLTAEMVAGAATIIATGMLDSTPIGPEPAPEPEPEPTPDQGGGDDREGGGGGGDRD